MLIACKEVSSLTPRVLEFLLSTEEGLKSINIPDQNGWYIELSNRFTVKSRTPVHWLVSQQSELTKPLLERLIKCGADVNLKTNVQELSTPIFNSIQLSAISAA